VRQIDTTKFSHIYFAFGDITPDFKISVGDVMSTYEFEAFRSMSNVQRVISFGGWAFSIGSDTYNIFRTGVTAANRMTLATNIANFVKDKGLDGVDIDWEYPGVCTLPLPPLQTGANEASRGALLTVCRNLTSQVLHRASTTKAPTTSPS
jgi:GH18 family chitinase